MINLNIDKTTFTKQDLVEYLKQVIEEINRGNNIGDDWDIYGEEEDNQEQN